MVPHVNHVLFLLLLLVITVTHVKPIFIFHMNREHVLVHVVFTMLLTIVVQSVLNVQKTQMGRYINITMGYIA